jgi:predicted dehydrogenase
MRTNKVLIIGTGSIGARHLKNIKMLLPECELKVLGNRQLVELAPNFQELIDFHPDMAIICNPASFHISVAQILAGQGVHLFIEKPLSNTTDGIEELMSIVDKNQVKIMVGYNLRFSDSLLKFKSLLQSQHLGRALMASAEVGQYLPSWRPEVDYRNTVSAQAVLGGGALLELSHELDYLLWLFGKSTSVSAKLFQVSNLDIDVEDLVLARIDFEQEGKTLPVTMQLDFLQRKPCRVCKVICEKGEIIWDAIEDIVSINDENGSDIIFHGGNDRALMYIEEIKQFVACIEHDEKPPLDIKDAYKVLKLIEAINESSTLGKTIAI